MHGCLTILTVNSTSYTACIQSSLRNVYYDIVHNNDSYNYRATRIYSSNSTVSLAFNNVSAVLYMESIFFTKQSLE